MEPPPNTRFVPLTNSDQVAIIDEEDWPRVSPYRWNLNKGYAQAGVRGKTVKLHRFIINAPEGQEVDHIDRQRLNNRKSNLRLATRAQNCANKSKQAGTTSQYKGVCWNKSANKWQTAITENGVKQYLGLFNNEEDAARVYAQAAARIFDDFAYSNFKVANIETFNLTINLPPQ